MTTVTDTTPKTDPTVPGEVAPTSTRGGASDTAEFDDVMLAMDVVDTLRRRTAMVERELATGDRREELINRLREIYAGQGIEVPDRILEDGVAALEENRFAYEPKQLGLQGWLAGLYISRDRWLKPFAAIFGAAAFLTASYEVGISGPRDRVAQREAYELTEVIPASLEDAREAALSLTPDDADAARARIESAYTNGIEATTQKDITAAENHLADLRAFQGDLSRALTIRVVSRPGERSGVFRIPRDQRSQRNYYLIVEAVDASGTVRPLEIASEEDQTAARVEKWGIRVPKAVYDRIAADKQDDQIIQNAVVGQKPKGRLSPRYTVDTAGGAILEW